MLRLVDVGEKKPCMRCLSVDDSFESCLKKGAIDNNIPCFFWQREYFIYMHNVVMRDDG